MTTAMLTAVGRLCRTLICLVAISHGLRRVAGATNTYDYTLSGGARITNAYNPGGAQSTSVVVDKTRGTNLWWLYPDSRALSSGSGTITMDYTGTGSVTTTVNMTGLNITAEFGNSGTQSYTLNVTKFNVDEETAASPTPSLGPIPTPASSFGHVFLLVEENRGYSSVVGNTTEMPYFNSLISRGALATNYYANDHPSLPNYIELTSGSNNGVTTDECGTNPTFPSISVDNIVRDLTNAGVTWRDYAEDIPSTGYLGCGTGYYNPDHVPFRDYTDVQISTSQQQNIVPFTQFATDLRSDTFAKINYVAPNMVNDGHSCPGFAASCSPTPLQNTDSWLQANIQPLLDSPMFQPGGDGLLIIVWDEGDFGDASFGGGQVAWLAIGPQVKVGYRQLSTTVYQHDSTLRLIMEAGGLASFPGVAATAPDMTEFFGSTSATATPTAKPTPMPTPKPTATPAPTPATTPTPTPASTPTPSAMPTPTARPTPTAAPTPTPISAPTPTRGPSPGKLVLSTVKLGFGTVGAGTSRTKVLKINNHSAHGVLVGNVSAIAAPFALMAGGGAFKLSGGHNRMVTVRFEPAAPGPFSGTLTITSNDPARPSVDVTVTGNGTPGRLVIPAHVAFSKIQSGMSESKTFKVKNSGAGVLHGNVSSVVSAPFLVTAGFGPFLLGHGQTTTVTVQFEPSLPGAFSDALGITSDDPARASIAVSLTGSAK